MILDLFVLLEILKNCCT